MLPPNLRGDPLIPSDYEHLDRSWIDRPWADTNLLRRASSPEGATIVGRPDNGSYAGLLFANIWPGENHVREYRLRRDKSELVVASDGRAMFPRRRLGRSLPILIVRFCTPGFLLLSNEATRP